MTEMTDKRVNELLNGLLSELELNEDVCECGMGSTCDVCLKEHAESIGETYEPMPEPTKAWQHGDWVKAEALINPFCTNWYVPATQVPDGVVIVDETISSKGMLSFVRTCQRLMRYGKNDHALIGMLKEMIGKGG